MSRLAQQKSSFYFRMQSEAFNASVYKQKQKALLWFQSRANKFDPACSWTRTFVHLTVQVNRIEHTETLISVESLTKARKVVVSSHKCLLHAKNNKFFFFSLNGFFVFSFIHNSAPKMRWNSTAASEKTWGRWTTNWNWNMTTWRAW